MPIDTERPAERAERAYVSLRAAIIEGALTPRTKLGEESLASHYGVSRTLIRNVLSRLVGEGLVDTGRGKSAEVAEPTLDEARDAFAVRAALEREAIDVLAGCWTPAIAARLNAHIDAERVAWSSKNAKASARLGGQFHIELAAATGNALLHRYVSEVVSRTALILTVYGRDIDQQSSIDEHQQLVDLLAAGDRDGAHRLAMSHLGEVERKTLRAPQSDARSLAMILAQY
ncbi:GntR family transcriptional regulator [Microbacterium sp. C7(2022)]|uniref:GntR family transcriptional regulator n=1 Tax=Microbacterium sp. C7(2022) TaxID=2992759 RepID=UPI00237A9999|nr:GntR family transcriptional regulator [Microbacterium sp. C7(2022)]MDE0547421.1 GntR family transcriptional regulator [Microbacterium sp. C7(2022)]